MFNSLTKVMAKRNTLSHLLPQLNLKKSCLKLSSPSSSNKFLLLIKNLEFEHLLESLGSPLPVYYLEYPQSPLGKVVNQLISQITQFCQN